MHPLPSSGEVTLAATLKRDGFAFVGAADMRRLLARYGSLDDWRAFTASWGDLAPDAYLAVHGHYRRRRHAVYSAAATGPLRHEAHQPHYQSRHYNPLQGDIERWFEPIRPEIHAGSSLRTILAFARDFFTRLAPTTHAWHIEVHQFRIEARPDEPGLPTPEGVHRDGVDYVLVLLIDRRNVVSGTTTIHADDGSLLGSFTLTAPLDTALVIDARVSHGVTPVQAFEAAGPAHRDVLVVTFRSLRAR